MSYFRSVLCSYYQFFLITALEEGLRVFQVVPFLISVTRKYGIISDKPLVANVAKVTMGEISTSKPKSTSQFDKKSL